MTCCDVWNAFIVGFCTPVHSSVILVILVLSLDPFVHPCVARVLIFNPPFFNIVSQLLISLLALYLCLCPQSEFTEVYLHSALPAVPNRTCMV